MKSLTASTPPGTGSVEILHLTLVRACAPVFTLGFAHVGSGLFSDPIFVSTSCDLVDRIA